MVQSFDRDFGDILALQDEIATGIARALQLSIDADESPPQRQLPNAEAYALYLRGLLAQDQQSFEKLFEAVRDFEQALALNLGFLRAAEALARAHVDQGFDEAVLSRDAWQSAREAAQRALRIDSKPPLRTPCLVWYTGKTSSTGTLVTPNSIRPWH